MLGAVFSAAVVLCHSCTQAVSVTFQRQAATTHAAATATLIPGLEMGTFEGGVDVIFDGRLQPGYSAHSPTVVRAEEQHTRFWMWLEALGGQPEEGSVTETADPSDAIHVAVTAKAAHPESVNVTLLPRAGLGSVSAGDVAFSAAVGDVHRPVVLDLAYGCKQAGVADIILTLAFSHRPHAPLKVHLRKACGARPCRALSLGSDLFGIRDGGQDVVHAGMPRWTTETASSRLVGPDMQSVSFYWLLQPQGALEDFEPVTLDPPQVRVTTVAWSSDEDAEGDDGGGRQLSGIFVDQQQHWMTLLREWGHQEELLQRRAGKWGLLDSKDAKVRSEAQQVAEPGWPGKTVGEDIVDVTFSGLGAESFVLTADLAAQPWAHAGRPALQTHFSCREKGVALIEVQLSPSPAYQPYHPIMISFLKICGDEFRPGFDVTAQISGREVQIMQDGQRISKIPAVGNKQSSFKVRWQDRGLALGAGASVASRVMCNGVAHASVQDIVGPGVQRGRANWQEVKLECHSRGVSTCWLQYLWGTQRGPAHKFTKACGGVRDDIVVTSVACSKDNAEESSAAPVLAAALVQHEHSTSSIVLSTDKDIANFSIALKEDLRPGEDDFKLGQPQIRTENGASDIVHVVVPPPQGGFSKRWATSQRNNSINIPVGMECLASGIAQIDIIFPVVAATSSLVTYEPLTLSVEKTCIVEPIWQQKATGILAVIATVLLVSGGVMSACLLCSRSRLQKNDPGDDDV